MAKKLYDIIQSSDNFEANYDGTNIKMRAKGSGWTAISALTQSEYDELTPDAGTLYVIKPGDPPPPDPPPSSITLLGDPDFNPTAPTWWDGTPITGAALTEYQGLLWWADEDNWTQHTGINSGSDGGLDDLADSDDLYKMGRYLRDRMQCLTLALALTRDLRFLDTLVRVMDIAAGDLKPGYRRHNPSVVTWPASPYRIWVNTGGGFSDDITGTDLATMNEVKWHAAVAEVTYALYLNRNHPSPAGYDYQAKYDYWIDYLTNDFIPKWRGGGTGGWRNKYRGVRRTPNFSSPHHRATAGEWPIVVNGGEGHSSVSSTHLAYYMHLLTNEQSARDEFEWMSTAWLDVDCQVVSGHRIYPHTSPAQGSGTNYAQRSAYVNYNQADAIVAHVLGMWPERWTSTVIEQMALSFKDWFLLPDFLSIGSSSTKGTYGNITGNVARGTMTNNPDSGRTMQQLIINPYFLIAPWGDVDDEFEHIRSFSGAGTPANPRVPFFNTAKLLEAAP